MSIYKIIWDFRKLWLKWILILSIAYILFYFGFGPGTVALILITIGLWTKTFYQTLTFLGLIPRVGLYLFRVLTIPFFWLVNSVGLSVYKLFSGKKS